MSKACVLRQKNGVWGSWGFSNDSEKSMCEDSFVKVSEISTQLKQLPSAAGMKITASMCEDNLFESVRSHWL